MRLDRGPKAVSRRILSEIAAIQRKSVPRSPVFGAGTNGADFPCEPDEISGWT